MRESDVLDFVIAMCDTGESRRYGRVNFDLVAEQFSADLAEQARERFHEGRALLQQVKNRLRTFAAHRLATQLREALGDGVVKDVKVPWSGIYQWTVIIGVTIDPEHAGAEFVALMFGPTAQFEWNEISPDTDVDYSRVSIWSEYFVDGEKVITLVPSAVTLQEVLDGLDPHDVRLRDEILGSLPASVDVSPTGSADVREDGEQ